MNWVLVFQIRQCSKMIAKMMKRSYNISALLTRSRTVNGTKHSLQLNNWKTCLLCQLETLECL